jgi:hypothetical protein
LIGTLMILNTCATHQVALMDLWMSFYPCWKTLCFQNPTICLILIMWQIINSKSRSWLCNNPCMWKWLCFVL